MRHDLPLVGRSAELALCRDRLQLGAGGILLVAGEAGAGKTRLVLSCLEEAKALGYSTSLVSNPGPGPSPRMGLWSQLPFGGGLPADPYRLAQQVAAQLHAEPSLLILEDIHWADTTSLEVLRYLPGVMTSGPTFLVLSYRPEELFTGHPLHGVLPILHRGRADVIQLSPLTEVDVEHLARSVGRPEISADLFRRSGGNPFFTCALLDADAGAIPQVVRYAVDEQLHRLDTNTRDLLRTVAVMGDSFAYQHLIPLTLWSEERLLHALEEATVRGILEEIPDGFRFRHRLVREILYTESIAPRRMRLHRIIADLVDDVAARAHHLASAGVHEAVPALQEAGRQSLNLGDYSTAYQFLMQSVQLLPSAASGEVLLLAGAAARHAAPRRAASLFLEAKQAGNDAVVAALADQALAWIASHEGHERAPLLMDRAHRALMEVWQTPRLGVLQALISGRRSSSPGCMDGIAYVYLSSGRPDSARNLLDEVRREAGSSLGEFDADVLAEVALLKGDLDTAFWFWQAGVDDALGRRNYAAALHRLAIWLEHLVLDRGTDRAAIEQVASRLTELVPAARRTGLYDMGSRGPLQALWYVDGDWESIRYEHATLPPTWQAYSRRWQVRVDLAENRLADASAALLGSLTPGRSPRFGEFRYAMSAMTTLATLRLREGDLPKAEAWLTTVDQWQSGPRPSPYNDLENLLAWTEYWRAAGLPDRALESALAVRDQAMVCQRTTSALLPALLHLGQLDLERSSEHLEAAALLAEQSGQRRLQDEVAKKRPRETSPRPMGLTNRELEIAALVARGLTDREIAVRLVISPRTVDGHLRNVFAKLKISSRAGLAVWVARQGLLPPDGE